MKHQRTHRASSDVAEIDADLTAALLVIRKALGDIEDESEVDIALCSVETFAAVALRVMRRTNPSQLRDCARHVEIKGRLDGLPVLRGAA